MPAALVQRIAVAAVLASALALPPLVAAQPGGDAAAQGWRKTNEPYFLGAGDRKWLKDYGVVAGRCNRQAVAGVVSTPPTGPEISRDEVATLRGSVALPKVKGDLPAADRACLGHTLELAPDGRAVSWADPSAGYAFRVVALRSYQALGWPCREFALEVTRGKQAPDVVRGRACRTEDGVWGISA
jgi:surface antigen